MHLTPDTTVGDIVTAFPETIKVFQRHKIDFCCGGKRRLGEVCDEQRTSYQQLSSEIRAAVQPLSAQERDWTQAPLTELVRHVLVTYHEPLREELPRLARMAEKVLHVHGERHPTMIPPLVAIFDGLKAELEAHMLKEEVVLFPAIVALETAGEERRTLPRQYFASVSGPIAVMEDEHEHAGRALAEMRHLTREYEPPEGACHTLIGLFHGLAELEAALHLHINLENNILFPRASRLDG